MLLADIPTQDEVEGEEEEEEDKSVFLAFARIYSGSLSRGQEVYVLQPRYDPRMVDLEDPQPAETTGGGREEEEDVVKYAARVTVTGLYILMGREVIEVESVPAGNVLGVAGLEGHILKSATISSTLACPAFHPMHFMAAPILRVAVEPFYAGDMGALARGMRLLDQADPRVEISLQATGEYILSTAGEVHLQRCLDDLRDTFSRVKLSVSAPIVPFRETVIPPPTVDTLNETISSENAMVKPPPSNPLVSDGEKAAGVDGGVVTIQTPNRACTLLIEARPLPESVTEFLSSNVPLLKALSLASSSSGGKVLLSEETSEKLKKLRRDLSQAFSAAEGEWSEFPEIVEKIWSFGPKSTGPNVLLHGLEDYRRGCVWRELEGDGEVGGGGGKGYDHSIVYGFQLASLSGPLCEEPMRGVCFILRGWSYTGGGDVGREAGGGSLAECSVESSSKLTAVPDAYGPFSGQLISTVKEGCRRAFLSQPARLMAAMYTCDILATAEVLGRLYAVLGRRNGRVCAEEMREGSTVFSVQAMVPVAESFGFAEEVRKKTSGLASPQLVFSHWEVYIYIEREPNCALVHFLCLQVIPNDPFWVPSSEEELLHYGEKADSENLARRYIVTHRSTVYQSVLISTAGI